MDPQAALNAAAEALESFQDARDRFLQLMAGYAHWRQSGYEPPGGDREYRLLCLTFALKAPAPAEL